MKVAPANKDTAYKAEPPDIFKAVRDDDIYELRMALEDGQSLRTSQPTTALTPIHVAAMRGSVEVIKVAMEHDPVAESETPVETPRRNVQLDGLRKSLTFEIHPADGIEKVEVSALEFFSTGGGFSKHERRGDDETLYQFLERRMGR
jgi:hypothetical protein